VAIIDWDVHVANGAERITASPSTRSSRRSRAASGPTVRAARAAADDRVRAAIAAVWSAQPRWFS
jgi:acetoin utilization deacetylase AcuC-like enzyme